MMTNNLKTKKSKILIVGGANNASLAITQSLGLSRKYDIHIIGTQSLFNKALYSRFTSRRFRLPNPSENLPEFIDELRAIIKQHKYDFVLPTNDRFSLITARLRGEEQFKQTTFLIEEIENLLAAMDKSRALQLAASTGCPIPKHTFFTDKMDKDDIVSLSNNVSYPVVVKPRLSWDIKGDKLIQSKIYYVNSKEEFLKAYNIVHALIPFPIIQNKIEGDGWGIEILAKNGEIKQAFSHKRLREANPTGSYSSAVEAIALAEPYLGHVKAMVRVLGWTGVCMFEFKNDNSDNIAKLMEINARFWGSLPVAIKAGADFPNMLLELNLGNDTKNQCAYKVGTRSRWLIADLVHLVKVFRGPPKGWTGLYPKPFKTVMECFKFYQYSSYNSETIDPLPGLLELFIEPISKLRGK